MAGSTRPKSQEQGLEELNLVEFPLGLLCDKRPLDQKTIEFCDSVRDSATGRDVVRRVIVTGADEWGLPTWQDIDVLLALMKLTNDRHRFAERTLHFSLYELRETLAWPSDGRYKKRLKESVLRLLGVTVAYENAWRSNGKWKSVRAFHLLDNVALTNTPQEFDPEEEQHVKWNDVIVESVRASNTKGIDWGFYLSLKLPTTKRLYRFLDKRFGLRPDWDFGLVDFCHEKLGMSRSAPVWECRRQLQKGVEELEKRGFIPRDENRISKVGKGTYRVRFRSTGKRHLALVPDEADSAADPLVAELQKRGVTNAEELVAKFPAELVTLQLENFDDRKRAGEKISPGWLRKAIETPGGYGCRDGFKSKAQKESESKARDARLKREQERKRAEEAAREAEAAAAKAELESFLAALGSDEARKAFEERAVQNGNGFLTDLYRRAKREEGESGGMYREILLRDQMQREKECLGSIFK